MQHELSGRIKTVKIFASSSDTNCSPDAAVSEKKAMGAQHKKSVNTSNAIRLAILESFEFQACDPLIAQYICIVFSLSLLNSQQLIRKRVYL